ncbi:VOC family protein [Paenibacillus sp. FSL W8-0186]|uniref:Extradiol dioxygenase n=1 Tax=Paenibacillus woosongensis TaxID=307580 RepID=A0ABQ4MU78_9BACL|nr:VOC family protein [Paenibacillus woosongensis]GIP59492.1 extradiol dioxygenase [Paenibacillus woosongensis]
MALQCNQIFVNLPVKDLPKTKNFFEQVGFEFNPQFTDEKAACLVISEHIYAMLLSEAYFKTFTKKDIPDTKENAEVIVALSASSREQVDEIVERALAAGGQPFNDPVDHGFMYTRSFQDPDGHLWEVVYMDPATIEQG